MEIRPTSIVKLFSGIPLDPTYSDTLYFDSLSAQASYFNTLTPVKTFTSQMYQRVNKGVFEANCSADEIYNCNYMAFQNSGFGNKWFYAFIKNVEYINNHNAQVTFEIDVMQTWMFDCRLERCFIERQHSVGDAIGSNILPEPVNVGEYVYDDYSQLVDGLNHYAILLMVVTTSSTQSTDGSVYDNVYSGGKLYAVYAESTSAVTSINEFLDNYVQTPESIVNMYMCPIKLLPIRAGFSTQEDSYDQVAGVPSGVPSGYFTAIRSSVTQQSMFGTYTPKNKKLFTYPYNFFHVDNGDGDSLNLRYEFFQNYQPQMKIEGCFTSPVQVKLTPTNYKGITTTGANEDRTEFLSIGAFPICSWNYDTYRAWVAQNSVPMAIQTLITGASFALALGTGGVGAIVASGVGTLASVVNTVSKGYTASIQADTCKGNIQSGNVNFATKKQTFYGGRCRVTADYAEVIDNFFNMFGYAYNKIGIPNTHSRPHWNYVKTVDAKIIGNCPSDDLVKICDIYNKGITFWKNPSEVGSYELDNSPT